MSPRRPAGSLGKTPLDRARLLHGEAIAAYRRGAAVLARPEVREAAESVERAADLVREALAEVIRPIAGKLGLDLDGKDAAGCVAALDFFLDFLDVKDARSYRRWTSERQAPIRRALNAIDQAGNGRGDFGGRLLRIPDMRAVGRVIVRQARIAIEETERFGRTSKRSPLGKQIAKRARFAIAEREDVEQAARRPQKPFWPKERVAVFRAAKSVRTKAIIGGDSVTQTVIPERLARACGATKMEAVNEVLAQLPPRRKRGRPTYPWVKGHPALIKISVPGTSWKASVLAVVVPTKRCPAPQVGADWTEVAVGWQPLRLRRRGARRRRRRGA